MANSQGTKDKQADDTEDGGGIIDAIKLILFLGIGYATYALFTSDPDGDKFSVLVELNAPADQKMFLEIVGRSVATAKEAANDASEAAAYIRGNSELCNGTKYTAFDTKVGWVGVFDEAELTDSNSKMYVEIDIGLKNKIRSEVPTDYRDTVLALKAGQAVFYSGSFRHGNMNENQCLDSSMSIFSGSNPKLSHRRFAFELQRIDIIAD